MNKNRMTIQKRIIMEELEKTRKHPTAESLYDEVKKRLPEISIGTVYRNLEILTKNGTAQKLVDSKRKNRFDGNPEIHFQLMLIVQKLYILISLIKTIQVLLGETYTAKYLLVGDPDRNIHIHLLVLYTCLKNIYRLLWFSTVQSVYHGVPGVLLVFDIPGH